jgi:hypothetical protein
MKSLLLLVLSASAWSEAGPEVNLDDFKTPEQALRVEARARAYLLARIRAGEYRAADDYMTPIYKDIRDHLHGDGNEAGFLKMCDDYAGVLVDMRNQDGRSAVMADTFKKWKIAEIKGETVRFDGDDRFYAEGDHRSSLIIDRVRPEGVDFMMKYMRRPYIITLAVEVPR